MHVKCADFVYKAMGELIRVLYQQAVSLEHWGSRQASLIIIVLIIDYYVLIIIMDNGLCATSKCGFVGLIL